MVSRNIWEVGNHSCSLSPPLSRAFFRSLPLSSFFGFRWRFRFLFGGKKRLKPICKHCARFVLFDDCIHAILFQRHSVKVLLGGGERERKKLVKSYWNDSTITRILHSMHSRCRWMVITVPSHLHIDSADLFPIRRSSPQTNKIEKRTIAFSRAARRMNHDMHPSQWLSLFICFISALFAHVICFLPAKYARRFPRSLLTSALPPALPLMKLRFIRLFESIRSRFFAYVIFETK